MAEYRRVPVEGNPFEGLDRPLMTPGAAAMGILPPSGPEMRPYVPTLRDRLAAWMMGNAPSTGRTKAVEGLMGSRGTGTTGMGLVDLTPAAVPLAYDEAAPGQGAVAMGMAMAPPLKAAKPLKAVKALPTTFWRGQNPGDVRRISTGNSSWDSHLFMADNPDAAKMYGNQLTQYQAAPDAKILREGTKEFVSIAGKWRKNENMLQYAARAAEAAKSAGYDAVWFKRQGDIGTAVFNPAKFPEVAPGVPALPTQPSIKAFHGSPHSFDRFSMDKIGTGEGAQAYGHGLYFAENEGVARSYREQLAGDGFLTGKGEVFDPSKLEHLNVRNAVRNNGPDLDATIARGEELLKTSNEQTRPMLERDLLKLKELKAQGGITPNKGQMYEVRINADPEHFLDWDKPLSQQSPAVQESLKQLWGNSYDRRMNDIYNSHGQDLAAKTMDPVNGRTYIKELNEAGIPGIRYLDQGSRGKGEGSSNFVVFNDKLIEILRKYGIAGLAALPPAIQEMARARLTPVEGNPFEGASGKTQ